MGRDTKGKITQPPATKRPAPTPTDTLPELKRHKTNTSDSDESGKQLDKSEEAGEESRFKKHNQPERSRETHGNPDESNSADTPDSDENLESLVMSIVGLFADHDVMERQARARFLRLIELRRRMVQLFSEAYNELTPEQRAGAIRSWQNAFPGTYPPIVHVSTSRTADDSNNLAGDGE